ncbi:MAG: hypothetical protein FD189_1554 [Elusimicrobia bacterium]|nr:MAG: hypothetical protein FD154_1789 [Elusimicrobiota bacterium]KAF0155043.1 MAG: hypothetical protein FD189_1554 [Elusimicrobiota bacterium]
MKALFTLLLACCFPVTLLAEVFRDSASNFEIDFPAGWAVEKSNDPAVILRLGSAGSFAEFTKLDSELSDYYLKARVKEQVDSLRSKGNTISGEVKPVSIRGVTTAYYVRYDAMGSAAYISFLTYNEKSYAVSARGVDETAFRNMLGRFRKPGEVIKAPASPPRKPRVVASKVPTVKPEDDLAAQVFRDGAQDSTGTAVMVDSSPAVSMDDVFRTEGSTVAAEPAPPAGPNMAEAAAGLLSRLSESAGSKEPPYISRSPLPVWLAGLIAGLWLIGAALARSSAAKYRNPKIALPPADVPPDFFFPFLVSRHASSREVEYRILTRQKQSLGAYYDFAHDIWLAAGFYGLVLFHLLWAFAGLLPGGNPLTNLMLGLPGGRLIASVPDLVFLLPLIFGLYKRSMRKEALEIFDHQSNKIFTVRPENAYGLLRDGNGKEVARLVEKTDKDGRCWEFVDTDNLVVFAVRDDAPAISKACRFFGVQGGRLRKHYGVFVQDRRAGYVFLDPSSPDRFQLHLEYNYSRLSHPAHILAVVLYVISREREHAYPTIL